MNDGTGDSVEGRLRCKRWRAIALCAAMLPAVALLLQGCELSGNYHDENVQVQFGNTNRTTQPGAQ